MNSRVVLLLTILFSTLIIENIKAQSSQNFAGPNTSHYLAPTLLNYGKATADEPLLAVVNYSFDSGTYSIIDSNAYSWSGARTSQQQSIPFAEVNATQFDTSTHYNIYFAGTLDYNSRYLQTFTLDGLVSEKLRQSWVDGKWMNNSVENNIYSGKFLQERISKTWNPSTSSWYLERKETYNYVSGTLVNIIYESLNPMTTLWEKAQSKSYSYSGSDTSEILDQEWDGFGWLNYSRVNYNYAGGKLVSEIHQTWDTVINNWKNSMKWEYTYPSGLLETAIVSFWNSSGLYWQNVSRNEYSYSGVNLISFHSENWDNVALSWQSQYKYIYDYSGANVSKMVIQYWDTITHSLKNNQQFVYEYNLRNALAKTSIYYWYSGGWYHPSTITSALRKYYYASSSAVLEPTDFTKSAFIAPNPVKEGEITYLNFYADSENKASIDLINPLGQQILHLEPQINIGMQSVVIPLDNLPVGVYFLKLNQGSKFSQTLRLVK